LTNTDALNVPWFELHPVLVGVAPAHVQPKSSPCVVWIVAADLPDPGQKHFLDGRPNVLTYCCTDT
jgi:hypothetical protein